MGVKTIKSMMKVSTQDRNQIPGFVSNYGAI